MKSCGAMINIVFACITEVKDNILLCKLKKLMN
jgi:hypothetical protein